MKILVFADSHGVYQGMVRQILRHRPDMVIHLGDCVHDAWALQGEFPQLPIVFVRGNNDPDAPNAPIERVLKLDKTTVYMTHGHVVGYIPSLGRLAERAQAAGASIALFGHTHIAMKKQHKGILLFNPGSVTCPRLGRAAYGVIETGAEGEALVIRHETMGEE